MGELNSDVCIRDSSKLWPKGIIPYEFNYQVTNNLQQNVEIAMKEISKVSSIRFVRRTNQLDFIAIVDKGGYWSFVGKQGGKQELSVTSGWQNPTGSAIHELLHSCGMFHEHSRPDRDKYVVVYRNDDCDYRKLKSSDVKCFSKYDFESIMHYPLTSCLDVKPGVKKPNSKIGQRVKLSKGDIKAINKLYPSWSCFSTQDNQRGKGGKTNTSKCQKKSSHREENKRKKKNNFN